MGLDPRRQFGRAEGLRQIIIRAEIRPLILSISSFLADTTIIGISLLLLISLMIQIRFYSAASDPLQPHRKFRIQFFQALQSILNDFRL